MILCIRDDEAIVAVLQANGHAVALADVLPEYEAGLQRLIRDGIQYPDGTPLAKFNAPAGGGDELLKAIGELYSAKFRLRYTLRQIVRPISRPNDFVIRLPDQEFGDLPFRDTRVIAEIGQRMLFDSSMSRFKDMGPRMGRARRDFLEARSAFVPAASFQLAFVLGARPSDVAVQTVRHLLTSLSDTTLELAEFREVYGSVADLLIACPSIEFYSEHAEAPRVAFKAEADRDRFERLSGVPNTHAEITGKVAAWTDSTLKITVKSTFGPFFNCYFTSRSAYRDIKAAPENRLVRVVGYLRRRRKIHLMKATGAEILPP